MIQTPASGPFSPTTCPPMSWAEILTLAARTAPPCISANALTPVAINRFNFMSRSPIMRHSRNRLCLHRLWHTVGHGSYFDQSLLLVEGSARSAFRFSHGEKQESRSDGASLMLTIVRGQFQLIRRFLLPVRIAAFDYLRFQARHRLAFCQI